MRRSTLSLIRCPVCRSGPLEPEGAKERLRFSPVTCASCGTVFPLAEGILDLIRERRGRLSLAQRVLETRAVARVYERTALGLRARPLADEESEHVLLHALLAPPPDGTILDLSCGTAPHARRLAVTPGVGAVIGLDLSMPMLHEAVHHLGEAGAAVDLLRADAASIPLQDGSVDRVLNVGALHLYPDPMAVLREVSRILVPGGRLVAASLLPERVRPLDKLEDRLGLHRRNEAELRHLTAAAGLHGFERLLLPPWIVFRAEKPKRP